jgi:hypothetical protein
MIIRINSTLNRLFFTSGKMHPHWGVGNTVQWVWSPDASGTIVTIFSEAVLEPRSGLLVYQIRSSRPPFLIMPKLSLYL